MVIAAIVAGGTGSRMGNTSVPKQFFMIKEKPVIIHTLEKFIAHEKIDHIMVGIHKDWMDYLKELISTYFGNDANIVITPGGEDRNGTMENLLNKACELWTIDAKTIFVTHDAVRPFVTEKMITDNIDAAKEYGVCNTVIPATDTILRSEDGNYISEMPVRAEMFQCQTPQTFQYGLYKQVYESLTPEELATVTDAAKLFFLRDVKVYLVEGSQTNIKITYPTDIKIAELFL